MSLYYYIEKSGKKLKQKKIEVNENEDSFDVSMNGLKLICDLKVLSPGKYSLISNAKSYNVSLIVHEDKFLVEVNSQQFDVQIIDQRMFRKKTRNINNQKTGKIEITSPMPGKIVTLLVEKGQKVKEGEGLIVIEAMKMENEIKATQEAIVEKILVKSNEIVEANKTLLVLK